MRPFSAATTSISTGPASKKHSHRNVLVRTAIPTQSRAPLAWRRAGLSQGQPSAVLGEDVAMKKFILAGVVSLAFTASAFANQCPGDMAKIDEAIKTASLSEADMATVKELRAKGEEQHKAGEHAESVKTFGEAKTLLKLE